MGTARKPQSKSTRAPRTRSVKPSKSRTDLYKAPDVPDIRRDPAKESLPPEQTANPLVKVVHFFESDIPDFGRRLDVIHAGIVTVVEALKGQGCERDEEFAVVLSQCALDLLSTQIVRLSLEEPS